MLISQGDLSVFFANALVGGLTTLALIMLFWPLIAAGLRKIRSAA
jgi:putative tricarboxylic transport membrane protein